MIKVRSLIFN